MKRSEFKNKIKPIIEECIKEILFEEGILSGIIAEVVRGMGTTQPIVEAAPPPRTDPIKERMKRNAFTSEQSKQLKEHKNKLMAAIGDASYNGIDLFEGTTPAPNQASLTEQAGPLSGQAPGDQGVDITSLFSSVGNNWNAHMNEIKEGK